jgi:hypothetical protein
MVTIGDPHAKTRIPSDRWRSLSQTARIAELYRISDISALTDFMIVEALSNGIVVVEVSDAPSEAMGAKLRALQRLLRRAEDGIRIHRKAKSDVNALRRLRGVVVDAPDALE